MSDSVSPLCTVCGGSGSVYVGDHDGAAMWRTCDCTKPPPTPEPHESDQSRYASECDLCETDGTLHMWECPNNPLRPARDDYPKAAAFADLQGKSITRWGEVATALDEIDSLRAALVVAEAARNTAEQMVADVRAALDLLQSGYSEPTALRAIGQIRAAVAGQAVPTGEPAENRAVGGGL